MPDDLADSPPSEVRPERDDLVEAMNTAVSAMSDFASRLIAYLGAAPLGSPNRLADELRSVQESVVAPPHPVVDPDLALPVGATLHWLAALAGPDMAAAQEALRSRMAQLAQQAQQHTQQEAAEQRSREEEAR